MRVYRARVKVDKSDRTNVPTENLLQPRRFSEKFFTNKAVDILKMCDPDTTKSQFVHEALNRYFSGEQRGQLNLVFVMAHGEITKNKDVRLLLSDAKDDAKDEHSLILAKELVSTIAHADDSVTVAFVDACYSGKAGGLRVESLGHAAREEGTHVGLLVSSQSDEKSYAVDFTKAVLDIWKKKACPRNSSEFNSELLSRMDPERNTPKWLIEFDDSLCIDELLNPNRRVISIWRDPDRRDPFLIRLFDEKDPKKKPIITVNQDKATFSNPYLRSQVRGSYRIETYGPSDEPNDQKRRKYTLIDRRSCDLNKEVYCKYFFPRTQLASANLLDIQRQIYRSAEAHGYPDKDLRVISDDSAQIYASLVREDPAKARAQAAALRSSDFLLWEAMRNSDVLNESRVEISGSVPHASESMFNKLFDNYSQQNPGIRIGLDEATSGGGIALRHDKRPDFGITAVGFKRDALANPRVKLTYIPVAADAVVPVYNLPDAGAIILFTSQILADIYLGNITRWDDPAIVRVNPKAKLTDRPILVIHRADSGGATFIWTQYLARVSADWKKRVGQGPLVEWPIGMQAKGNEGVEAMVRGNEGSIGYVDFGYAIQRKMDYGRVRNRSGNFVAADQNTVGAAAEVSFTRGWEPHESIADPLGPNAYPITGLVWIVAPAHSLNKPNSAGVLDFATWFVEEDQAKESDLAPLPADAAQVTLTHIRRLLNEALKDSPTRQKVDAKKAPN